MEVKAFHEQERTHIVTPDKTEIGNNIPVHAII
jgi:hypothetical protein